MPRKTDKISIADPFLDRRIKMLPCQKERCIHLFSLGCEIKYLAKLFHVHRRLIHFLVYPDKLDVSITRRKEKGTGKYYNKARHKNSMQEHREHKADIFNSEKRK